MVPAFLYSLYLTLYKMDTSGKRTPRVGPCLSLLPIFDSTRLYEKGGWPTGQDLTLKDWDLGKRDSPPSHINTITVL